MTNAFKSYDGNIRKFNTIIDALNFMGKQGWIFINTYPVESGGMVIYHYAFKKEFYIVFHLNDNHFNPILCVF